MKRKAAKILSVFLAVCTVFMSASVGLVGASAADSPIPTVYLEGSGSTIFADTNDRNSERLNSDEAIPDAMVQDLVSQLAKPLLDAYLKNDFTEYCDKLVEVFAPYYSRMALDENGEIANGSGNKCLQEFPTSNMYNPSTGGYGLSNYRPIYDWRLDPFETAEYIHEYIERVKALTGSPKVNIVCRCLGVNILLAYVAAYGSDSINKCIIYAGGLRGFEYCGALFSGNVVIDSDSLERFANTKITSDEETMRIIKAIIQVANTTFMLKWGIKEIMDFYYKVYENVLPRLMRESHGSFPSYWSMVPAEDYDAAIEINFGAEREKYAKMIEKCDRYHNEVASRVDELINGMIENGVEVYNVVKYGYQLIPISKDSPYQSDGIVGVASSSCGATVTELTKKFSDSYIEKARENGTDKYISVDKTIDASTSILPDHTWFVKDLEHSDMPESIEYDLFAKILNSSTYMTVFDDPSHPQYMLYNSDTKSLDVLTEDNCVTEEEKRWQSDVSGSTALLFGKMIDALQKFITMIFDFVHSIVASLRG